VVTSCDCEEMKSDSTLGTHINWKGKSCNRLVLSYIMYKKQSLVRY